MKSEHVTNIRSRETIKRQRVKGKEKKGKKNFCNGLMLAESRITGS